MTTTSNPTLSAITGFVQINTDTYATLIANALVALRKAKADFEAAGYLVETIRVTTQPLATLVGGIPEAQALAFLKQLDDLSVQEDFVPNVGPAMLHDTDDQAPMHVLEQALSTLPNIQSCAIIADSDGIHWETIRRTAELLLYVSQHSPHSQGNLNFAAIAMQSPYAPLFPGSYFTEEGQQFAVGLECANLVQDVLLQDKGRYPEALADLTAALTQQASAADAIARQVAQQTSWNPLGVYLSLSHLGDLSVAAAIETYTGEKFGAGGTLTGLRLIAEAAQAAEQSGNWTLMLPVVEDKLLAQRWAEATYNIDSLLAYAAVGGMGLDTIPLPGDIHPGQLKRILSDVAVLAAKGNTPLSARLLPVSGKKPGDMTDFQGPSLFNTKVHPLP
jgi:hypothetical protein